MNQTHAQHGPNRVPIANRESPAARVITAIGGAERVAELTGRTITSVYRWAKPLSLGGTGGLVPIKAQTKLLELAKSQNLGITITDFGFREGEELLP